MNVKIVRRPIGEAPEWVRDAWIGLSLPLANKRQRSWRGVGVLSGPHKALPQFWTVITGKSLSVNGYAVNAKSAVNILAERNAKAAAWWTEHTPVLLDGKRNFVFDTDACECEF